MNETNDTLPLPGRKRRLLDVLGWLLLVAWCCWWVGGFWQSHLAGLERTWVRLPCFGVDFWRNVDQPSRIWVAGGDPYADPVLKYCYPPTVLPLFAWSSWMTPRCATAVWVAVLGLLAAAGAWAAWRARAELRLPRIPLVWVLAAVLFSTPVVFAMERANYDLISVPLVIAAVMLFRRKSTLAEVLAGALLAIAPWMKVYPGLLVVGLVGLRRWRALAAFVVAGAAIGLVQFSDTLRFLDSNRKAIDEVYALAAADPGGKVCPWQHSLTELWPKMCRGTPLTALDRIPGTLVSATLLLPLLAWVSYRVFQSPGRSRLAYPYLLWVLALASFVPPIANDYSLFSLPMAALAIWDRRNPRMVHVAMALMVLWWQPVALPIDGRLVLLIKLAGLGAVGVVLAQQAAAQAADALAPAEAEHLAIAAKAAA
jgi:hypothetical protein